MSKGIREVILEFAHKEGVNTYSTMMIAKQFPFSWAVHENVLIRPISNIKVVTRVVDHSESITRRRCY